MWSAAAAPRFEIQEMQAQDTNAKGGCVRHQGRQNGKRQTVGGKLTTAKVAMRRGHNRKQNTRVRWSLTPLVNYDIVWAEGQTVHRHRPRQRHKYSIQVDSNRQAQQGAFDDFGASRGEQLSGHYHLCHYHHHLGLTCPPTHSLGTTWLSQHRRNLSAISMTDRT